jgi:hypothetical protein
MAGVGNRDVSLIRVAINEPRVTSALQARDGVNHRRAAVFLSAARARAGGWRLRRLGGRLPLSAPAYDGRPSPPACSLVASLSPSRSRCPSSLASTYPRTPRGPSCGRQCAVEGDSVARLQARWSARLRQNASDRAALLGLATIARLTYDYPTADRLYPELFGSDSLRADPYTAYARLGRAWSLEERGESDGAGDEFARARRAARAAGDAVAEAEALIGLAFARGPTEGMTAAKAILDTAGTLIPSPRWICRRAKWRRAMIPPLGVRARRPGSRALSSRAVRAAQGRGSGLPRTRQSAGWRGRGTRRWPLWRAGSGSGRRTRRWAVTP